MVDLNEKLAKARLKTTIDENSFMNTLKEKSQVHKSSVLNVLNKTNGENDSASDNGDEWKTIDAYITELPESQLREEYKETVRKLKEYEL